ncbi:SDR family oxidoreductase [Chitinophaga caseinilytica]|uniref:SDR family oxidoreductase n=1 Tax=Chitinophaga caseinilytica TaxID=2267521 RepID=UPI003C2C577B
MKLKDKVIIVTGGSGLLGRAILEQIIKEGALAVNLDINIPENSPCFSVKADITEEKEAKEAIGKVMEKFGRIDGLVNNAYPRTKDWGAFFEDIPFDTWNQNVKMQMGTTFFLCQQVAEIMKKQQSGSIVNMSSIYGVVGPDFTIYGSTGMTVAAAYSAIKGGTVNFTRYLSAYLGPHKIRVNCISPGGIFDNQKEEFVRNYEAKVPLRRMGLPADIAPGVAFLLSEDSAYITGHNLIIDGGWTAI